jgi:DNA-binding response OmpR family regulator
MPGRILLVEDDADLRTALAAALRGDGHAVTEAPDGRGALDALADDGLLDLVLLDIALGPGPDGLQVCRRLRGADADVYVVMLTARGGEEHVVDALEAGADDYLTKPVGIAELRSRVRAALRRLSAAPGPDVLRHGRLALDPSARSVRVGAAGVGLTRSEFTVLEALLRAGGAVRSRAELVQAVYGDDAYRDPRGIDVHVHHVRAKLAAAGGDPGWLETVRGVGYRVAG